VRSWIAVCVVLTACGRFSFDPSNGDDQAIGDAAGDAFAELTTMWLFGGSDGSATQDQVWRTDDGINWSQVGALPAPRSRGAVFHVDGRLIFAGGAEGQGTAYGEIWESSDGASWSQIGTLPIGLAGMGYGEFQGRLWLIGGETAGGTSTDVVRSSADGITWQVVGNVTYPVHGAVMVVHGNRMYLVAGHNSAFLSTVISSADGVTWTSEPSLLGGREYHGVAIIQDQIWSAGGTPGFDDVRALTGASWTQRGTLPMVAAHAFLASYRGRFWLLSADTTDILSSTDGAGWVDEGNLPGPRSYFNALVTPAL
jgi:hypothetical protein